MKWPWLCAALFLALPAQAAPPVRFGDALHAKFHHDRCLQCHQFNSRAQQGRAFHSHRARYLCDNCHAPRLTGLARGEWMAPADKFDYTGLDARATCNLIKRNMGSGDARRLMREHLLDDARIRWSLESGMTPAGRFPTVPGSYDAWARDVKAWIDGGMICD